MDKMLKDCDWDEKNPLWASGHRVIANNYGPGEKSPLGIAIRKAEINDLWLPMNTIMWIDPDGIRVAIGYRVERELVYPKAE